jgi:Flp pilus assembly protein TadD
MTLRDSEEKVQTEAVSDSALALSRFHEGMKAMSKGDFSGAAHLFAQAAYIDHSNPQYHFRHGSALSKLERFRDAVDAINRALELDPNNGDFIAELGIIYLELGFQRRAKSAFERALQVSPSNQRAMEGMGRLNPDGA